MDRAGLDRLRIARRLAVAFLFVIGLWLAGLSRTPDPEASRAAVG